LEWPGIFLFARLTDVDAAAQVTLNNDAIEKMARADNTIGTEGVIVSMTQGQCRAVLKSRI
jgi:hypothetical protein